MRNPALFLIPIVLLLFGGLFGFMFMTETVSAGHSAAASRFGNVQETVYDEGLHIVNPLLSFTHYDCRQKTAFFEGLGVPSKDKLTTTMNVSVQYRLDGSMTPTMLSETGNGERVVAVHLTPKLHSLMREIGKSIERAEDFFDDNTQTTMQAELQSALAEFTSPKGIIVEAVLLSDVTLPQVIRDAVDQTKKRQEETAREQAEFERFQIEQKKRVAEASAQREAAEEEATMKRTLADAAAYEIEARGKALRENPEILRLESIQRWDGVLPRVLGGETGGMQFLLPVEN